jgi:hypothetical protein
VATVCTYCGTPLPRDDARFCTNCGMLVPSHPFSPKAASFSPSPAHPESTLREQIAQQIQPSSQQVRYPAQHEPPTWMSQLDSPTIARPFTPFPAIPQTDRPNRVESSEQTVERRNSPPGQERYEKVREQERQEKREYVVEDVDVNDLPTRPLLAGSPGLQSPPSGVPATDSQGRSMSGQNVEYLDTVPIATPRRTNPPSIPPEGFAQQPSAPQHLWSSAEQRQQGIFSHSASTVQQQPASLPGLANPAQSDASQVQERRPVSRIAVMKTTRRKSRKPLVFALVLLLLLAIGGIAAWIIQAQPFTVPEVTQPEQTYSNTSLGFSLSYPNGWSSVTNTAKRSVQLADSSQTDLVKILVQAGAGNTISSALQQEAAQLKMTNLQKGLQPVSFAGMSWQQIKGSIFVQGATYSGVVLMANHNNTLFTIVQMAPQTTFAQEDQLVFANMRSSFKFLS